MGTDLVAFIFGATIVVFYSYRRFNRRTDREGQQLLRLVNLLSPDKLRSKRVVHNAYALYATTFLIIYLFLCAYAQLIPALGGPSIPIGASALPALQTQEAKATAGFRAPSGAEVGDEDLVWSSSTSGVTASKPGDDLDFGIGAATSLAVALMIVGLAPSFPLLEDFETSIRAAAHRLAGIPTRVIGIRDALRNREIEISAWADEAKADLLLIPLGDWQRLKNYREKLTPLLDSPSAFQEDMALIFATSEWIIERKLNLPSLEAREQFAQLEHELKVRKDRLIDALDDKMQALEGAEARVVPPEAAVNQLPDGSRASDSREKPTSWHRLAKQVDELADDMCLLLALFIEHEIIEQTFFDRWSEDRKSTERKPAPVSVSPADQEPRRSSTQRKAAVEAFRTFLGEYFDNRASSARFHLNSTAVGLWTFFLTMAITSLWSLFPGCYELALKEGVAPNGYSRLVLYTSTAFIAYIIPITVALVTRDGSQYLQRWNNIWEVTWTQWLPQIAFVLVASFSAATAVIMALAVWRSSLTLGWEASRKSLGDTLGYIFAYNAPFALRGALLAVILIAAMDAWAQLRGRNSQPLSAYWSGSVALTAGVLMGFVGGATRLLSAWAGTSYASIPKERFDAVDRGLILYSAIYSGVLGFCLLFAVCEVLAVRSSRVRAS